MAKNRRKQKKEFEISNSHLVSCGLIGFGVIYLLSLISFNFINSESLTSLSKAI